uniref:AP2-1 n=1 Tax=Tetraena mongolica TaxID=66646 RepID=R4IL99_9ROSI|nr:AP2-1 [Tetraena mongolica]
MNSSSPQNWLGFSPSNQTFLPSNSSHLSLSQVFNTTPLVSGTRQQHATRPDDFLGSRGSYTSTLHVPASQQSAHLETQTETLQDYELKTIAASFLHGFYTDQNNNNNNNNTLKRSALLTEAESPLKKSADTFGQRTSIYRGVTRHRWTGRYEAHLWDNSCKREGQSRKGRQVYLGGYDKEEKAARAYDLAALKYWGPTTTTNFPISDYETEIEGMKHMNRQEFVASLRRKSSGFSRGASMYRGVTRHHQHGRWQARIGRVSGNKDLYLGTFSTQEEAAEAYDIAAIKFRGLNAVTNFDMSRYNVKSIIESNHPIGGTPNKSKNALDSGSESKSIESNFPDEQNVLSATSLKFLPQPSPTKLAFAIPIKQDTSSYWTNILGLQNTSPMNSTTVAVSNLYPHSELRNSATLDMNLSSRSASADDNSNKLSDNASCYIQEQSGCIASSSTISVATPLKSFISPTLHTVSAANPNLTVSQTLILGME